MPGVDLDARRGHPARLDRGEAGRAQAVVPPGRHHHRRQRLAAQRRRLRAAARLGGRAAPSAATRSPGSPAAGAHALEPQDFGFAPVEAADQALARAGITWADVAAVELNEAFAVQSLACVDAWKVDPEIVNAKGGAIAIGHPLGASGGRILGTLATRLRESGDRWGVAAICIGVGQALAVVLENVGVSRDPDLRRPTGRGGRRHRGRRDRADRRLRHGRDAGRADRRADPAGRQRPDRGHQQRRQRRHRAGRAAGQGPGAQGDLLVPAADATPGSSTASTATGKIELELVPQGNLAERMRAAGAGIGAFFCPTGVGTPLAEGKETREIDGRTYVLEYPIHGDVALIGAHRADRMGNLVYRKTARNFGPVMATAATTVDRPGRARSSRSASSTPRPS